MDPGLTLYLLWLACHCGKMSDGVILENKLFLSLVISTFAHP
jgi:hypothetical protein